MIDFKEKFHTDEEKSPKVRKRCRFRLALRISAFLAVFCFLGVVIFSVKAIGTNNENESWVYKIPIIGQLKHLAESADKELKGEDRDRINILLLGVGGKNHEGGNLTDTIILVSLEPSTKKASMMSIPRDMIAPMEGYGWRKINNINAYAEADEKGSGGVAVSQAVGDILQMPIDYYVRVDFQGFINIIDEVEGVNVYVENTLEDPQYPIMGMEEAEPYESRFEHLYIEKGWHKMDGKTALKYARSRHGLYGEGSDFARARRQQNIIQATKEKLLSKNMLLHPVKISNIFEELDENLTTNLKVWEIVKLWQNFKDLESDDIKNIVLDNGPDGLLVAGRSEAGAYILEPRSGDFSEIQYLVHNIFSDAPTEPKQKVTVEEAKVDIRNGTWVNGLAGQIALDLEKYNFEIINVANSSRKNIPETIIYDLTYGEKIESLKVLKSKMNADASFDLPQWLRDDIAREVKLTPGIEQPDFIIILGRDSDASQSGAENLQ